MPRLLAFNLCVVIVSVLSRGADASEPLRLSFDGAGLSLALLDEERATGPVTNDLLPDDDTLEAARPTPGYAMKDSTAWWFEVGGGSNFDEGWVALGGVGVEWYPVDGFALGARFDGIGVGLKDTSSTGGVDAALLIRWHVLRRET